jgi:hypothetical protein
MIHCHPEKVYDAFKLLGEQVCVAVFVYEMDKGVIAAVYTPDEFERMTGTSIDTYVDIDEEE